MERRKKTLTVVDTLEEVAKPDDGWWLNTDSCPAASLVFSLRGNVLFRQYCCCCWSSGELLSCIDVLAALVNDSSNGSSLIMATPETGLVMDTTVGTVVVVVGCATRILRPSSGSKRSNSESLLLMGTVFAVEPFDSKKSKSDDWKTTADEQRGISGDKAKQHSRRSKNKNIHNQIERALLGQTRHT